MDVMIIKTLKAEVQEIINFDNDSNTLDNNIIETLESKYGYVHSVENIILVRFNKDYTYNMLCNAEPNNDDLIDTTFINMMQSMIVPDMNMKKYAGKINYKLQNQCRMLTNMKCFDKELLTYAILTHINKHARSNQDSIAIMMGVAQSTVYTRNKFGELKCQSKKLVIENTLEYTAAKMILHAWSYNNNFNTIDIDDSNWLVSKFNWIYENQKSEYK